LKTLWEKYQTTAFPDAKKFRAGYRTDIGVTVRSAWEANVIRWFNHHGIEWEYEPRLFHFEKIKRGTKTYLPDFWLPEEKVWVEVKGYLKSQDKTKLKRFRKYHPDEFLKLKFIPKNNGVAAATFCEDYGIPIYAYYDDICEEADKIEGWE